MYTIRKAIEEDLSTIVAIYNQAIEEGGYTADLTTYTVDEKRSWFKTSNQPNYGIYVIEVEKLVVGYFYFSPWRGGRKSLAKTAEISFYLNRDYRGRGYGAVMLAQSIELAKEKSLENLLAILLDINIRSQKLLAKYGFVEKGHLPHIAHLGDKQCGQVILFKKL